MFQSILLESNSSKLISLSTRDSMRSKARPPNLPSKLSFLSLERNFLIFLVTKKSRIKSTLLRLENTFKKPSSTFWTKELKRRKKSIQRNRRAKRPPRSLLSKTRRRKVYPKSLKMPGLSNLFNLKNLLIFYFNLICFKETICL